MTDDRLPTYYACIWRATNPDETFDPAEFQARLPRLRVWLQDLLARGKLVACGAGGFDTHSGGLTILRADTVDEALALAAGSPMNEIGKTDVLVWDVYFADLSVPRAI